MPLPLTGTGELSWLEKPTRIHTKCYTQSSLIRIGKTKGVIVTHDGVSLTQESQSGISGITLVSVSNRGTLLLFDKLY